MSSLVLVFVSVALLLAVVAFRKEQRLRIALQELLRRLLDHWRAHVSHAKEEPARPHPDDPGDDRVQ